MADVFTKAQRSLVMSRVRGRGNASTELRTAALLRVNKVTGWRRNSLIFGKPDFVFRESKVALFVDGCFWHGCLRCYRAPRTSAAFWRAKIERNMQRDLKVSRHLKRLGWKVIRVKECQLETPARFLNRLKKVV
jgi:DNA mismatch endonuclease (patch repair protein)